MAALPKTAPLLRAAERATIEAMLVLGPWDGFTQGGVNFDAKIRRNSVDNEDIFIGHIAGIDTFARALLIAERIFFAGAMLPQFLLEIVGGVAMLVFVVLCPLIVFAGQLARAKRVGLGEYGVLAQRYVQEFDTKWIRGTADPSEPLVGSADVQSLADLANSFEVIKEMRYVPFSKETVMQLAVVTLAPVAPLLLTMISLEELVKRLLGAVF